MEVGSAVADVQSGSAEVWVASKSSTGAQSAVADAIGLSADDVTLHVIRGGGSFGRRIYYEPAVEAARVSKAIGKPVKLMWTRNDDMRHGRVRPRSQHQLRAVHAGGEVLSYEHRASAWSWIWKRHRAGARRCGLRQPDDRCGVLQPEPVMPVQLRGRHRKPQRGLLRHADRRLAVGLLRPGSYR